MSARALHLAALAALVSIACVHVNAPVQRPAVEIREARAAFSAAAGIEARMVLEVSNPGPASFELRALDWELAIGGAAPVRGRTTLDRLLPARGRAPAVVVLRVPASAAADMAARMASGARDYHVRGVLHLLGARADIGVVFDVQGALGQGEP